MAVVVVVGVEVVGMAVIAMVAMGAMGARRTTSTQADRHAGVMRFLQIEWHNHERARNAWDIERAEMKAKIAKQEGEVRSAKRLNDQLNKHIRMLEHALVNERAKHRPGGDASAADDPKDLKGKQSGPNPTKRASPRVHVCSVYTLTTSS